MPTKFAECDDFYVIIARVASNHAARATNPPDLTLKFTTPFLMVKDSFLNVPSLFLMIEDSFLNVTNSFLMIEDSFLNVATLFLMY